MNEEPEVPFEMLEPYEPQAELGGRKRDEPVSIGDALGWIFPRGVDDYTTAKHPFDGCCKFCNLPLELPPWTQIKGAVGWYPVNSCPTCYEAAKGDGELRKRQREQWERICPPDFRADWDDRKGNAPLLRQMLKFDPKLGKGLLIHGSTGKCKTRAAWRLTRDLMERGHPVTFVESIDLPDENVKDMMHAPILVIDDLGNDRMQANREALVLKILRHRCNWRRPTIITTQYTGITLAERFNDENTAKAVVRRLREFCDDVAA